MIIDANGKRPFEIRDSTGKEFKKIYDADGNLLFKNWNTIQGTPPIVFKGYNRSLKNYKSYGNTIQDGTPTPYNPVEVQGCGERTENLFNEVYPNIRADVPEYKSIFVGDGEFTLSTSTDRYGTAANLFFLAGSVKSGAATATNGVWKENPRTITSLNGYVTIAYRYYDEEKSDPRFNTTMLSLGSTSLPYEPYGYKLPITVNGTEYPIYLGQVETTRKIYKMRLLTPTSATQINTGYRLSFSILNHRALPYTSGGGFCNIAKWQADYNKIGFVVSEGSVFITQKIPEWATKEGATTWLKENEVYAWYILATPETTITNEPLHKIGNYADTITMPQADITIPTIAGTNTLTVDTTVKPSEIYLKGKIKSLATHMLVDSSGNVLLTSDNYQLVTKEE